MKAVFDIPRIIEIFPSSAKIGETIRITGENFSPVISENKVVFNYIRATVLKSSATELMVEVPNCREPYVSLRITVGKRKSNETHKFFIKPDD